MKPVSRCLITVLVLTLSAVFLSSNKSKAQPQGVEPQHPNPSFQGLERAVKKSREFNPPVSIEAVKTKGRSVELNKKYSDEDDWLKDFAVVVRNNSDKAMTHVGIKLRFQPPDGGTPAGWMLYFGPDPFLQHTDDSVSRSALPTVLPGGDLELKLNDAEFADLTAFLKKVGFPDKVHVVEVRVETIGFADGTAWYGRMLKRNSGPVKWIGLDTPRGPRNHHPQTRRGASVTRIVFLKQFRPR